MPVVGRSVPEESRKAELAARYARSHLACRPINRPYAVSPDVTTESGTERRACRTVEPLRLESFRGKSSRVAAPTGHGRALPVASPTGLAVLGCAAAFAGRPPRLRSLMARAPGRITQATAEYWVHRWLGCLSPPADAQQRARRLDRDLHRYRALQADITSLDAELTELLAATQGQVLTTLPGVAVTRAAAFAAFSLPIARFPDAEHLYSATGLAPAL